MRAIDGARMLAAAAALLFVSGAARSEGDEHPIRCVTGEAQPAGLWHEVMDVPAGALKYATWGDLRIEFKTRVGAPPVLHAFAVSKTAKLPERDKDPKSPAWIAGARAPDDVKSWVSLSDPDCRCVELAQGEVATQQILVIGVDGNPDKKGASVLWWRWSLPPREQHAVFATWAPNDAKIIMEDQWKAPDLKPRAVPSLSEKKEDTLVVLRKGKRVVAVVRHKPAGTGGDPFERLLIAVDDDAQKAPGAAALVAEPTTKALEKFMADHKPKEFDPRSVSFLLVLDVKTWFVMLGGAAGGARSWEIYEKPSS